MTSVLLALILILGLVVSIALRDEPPYPAPEMTLVRREVPAGSNGFDLVDLPPEAIEWPEDGDPEKERAFVESHQELLAVVDGALARADFLTPPSATEDDLCPFVLAWRRLAYALQARSRVRLEAGRDREAFEDAIRLVRFGDRIERAQGCLLYYLVGLAIRSIGANTFERCLGGTRLPAEEVLGYLRELERYPPRPEGLQDTLRAEYWFLAGVYERIPRGEFHWDEDPGFLAKLSFRLFLKQNQTRRVMAQYLACAIDLAGAEVQTEALPSEPVCGETDVLKVPVTNIWGRTFLRFVLPLYLKATHQRLVLVLHMRALETLFAIRRYEVARGELPATLEDLVPEYLEALPVDPFGGGILRYSPENRTLRSVGTDLVAEGGAGALDEDLDSGFAKQEEPTFRLLGSRTAPPSE